MTNNKNNEVKIKENGGNCSWNISFNNNNINYIVDNDFFLNWSYNNFYKYLYKDFFLFRFDFFLNTIHNKTEEFFQSFIYLVYSFFPYYKNDNHFNT